MDQTGLRRLRPSTAQVKDIAMDTHARIQKLFRDSIETKRQAMEVLIPHIDPASQVLAAAPLNEGKLLT